MTTPVANGIVHQLNAIAAHDQERAHGCANLMIEAAIMWRLAHGADAAQLAEYLQQLADTVFVAGAMAGSKS